MDDSRVGCGRDRDVRIACQVFRVEPDPLDAGSVKVLRHRFDVSVAFACDD